jgi:hypothetical protein
MAYSKDYFELQLNFATKVSQITKKKLIDVLLQYTSFYKTFRIEGWDFKPDNPTWRSFVNEFNESKDPLTTTYNFYLKQIEFKGEKNKKKLFGCFSYEYDKSKKSVSIHFRNVDSPEPGALSRERMPTRKRELKEMFREIKDKYPEAKEVWGFSWLYNLEAYKRLFPPQYMQHYKTVTNWYKSTALWGQFLDSSGQLKQETTDNFADCINTKNTISELKGCFPLKLLEPWADVKYFYQFYDLG